MKIPKKFTIRISTYQISPGGKNKNLLACSRNKYLTEILSRNLFEKIPIEFSYAQNRYNGGRYSENNKFFMTVHKELGYDYDDKNDKIVGIRFEFNQILKP